MGSCCEVGGWGGNVRRIEGWPVTTGQNTMHFHRLTLARIKTIISAAQSLWLTYLFILSEKVLSGGKKLVALIGLCS